MNALSITTPALLFPAITLLMLAYTNRFLAIAALVRKLHDEYGKAEERKFLHKQISNLRTRISMIRNMQALGVLSFLLCIICMYLIFREYDTASKWVFALSLLSLLTSLIFSLFEIILSTRAIDLELSDMELDRRNIFQTIIDSDDD
jgi:cellobiose-specific phosphotransferase system component IIC